MSAVKKITEKRVYASGEKVFTKIGSGLWAADLYNQSVTLERVHHDHWTCVVDSTKKLIGEGETRNEAMREAFYNEALEKGYDAKEADRLHWVLIPQKYRSYGGHKPRRKTVNNTSNVVNISRKEETETIDEESTVKYAEDALVRIQEALAHYKTSYNKVLGGWHYYKRDDQGNIEGGKIYGAFKNEQEMFRDIMERELKKFS